MTYQKYTHLTSDELKILFRDFRVFWFCDKPGWVELVRRQP